MVLKYYIHFQLSFRHSENRIVRCLLAFIFYIPFTIAWGSQVAVFWTGMEQMMEQEPFLFQEVKSVQEYPFTGEKLNLLKIYSTDQMSQKGDLLEAKGNVRFWFKDYDVNADLIKGNKRTEIFDLKGNVLVTGDDSIVTADESTINFKDRTLRYKNGRAELGPEFLKGNFIDDLYIRSLSGGGSKKEFETEFSETTTCWDKHPHFVIKSRLTNVKPGNRAILRDVDLYILDKKILHLPYLRIPLEEQYQNYIPEVGYTRQEGYYIKTRWAFPLQKESYVDAIIDYYTKAGFGLGGEIGYELQDQPAKARGLFNAYSIPHDKSLVTTWKHDQEILAGRFFTETTYSKNNRFTSPHVTSVSSRNAFELPQKNASTRVEYNRNTSLSHYHGNYHFFQDYIILNDRRLLAPGLSTNLSMNLNSTRREKTTEKFLDALFQATQDVNKGEFQLYYNRKIPIQSDGDFVASTIDRTPEVVFKTDAYRIFGPDSNIPKMIPFRTETSYGHFFDLNNKKAVDVRRIYFLFNSMQTLTQGKSTLNWNATFRQGIYSDDTAQYIIQGHTGYYYEFGKDLGLRLKYEHLRPYGFTPLLMDSMSQRSYVSSELSFRVFPSLMLGVQAAYDFLQLRPDQPFRRTPWEFVNLRTEWTPFENMRFLSSINYDPVRKQWGILDSRFYWKLSQGALAFSTRYDMERKTFGTINFLARSIPYGKLQASFLLSYNGYTKKMMDKEISLIYDLHCAEAILYYADRTFGFRPGQEWGLFLRLKALPTSVPFGIGTQGQPLGINEGFNF